MTELENTIHNNVNSFLEKGLVDEAKASLSSVSFSSSFQLWLAFAAIRHNSVDFLRWLLRATESLLKMKNVEGQETTRIDFLLNYAARKGALDSVKILTEEFGADIHAIAGVGNTSVFETAVDGGNVELARWFLDRGASPNSFANGCTACFGLMKSAFAGNLAVCKLLVEHGGLVNALNAFGLSPLSYAMMGGKSEVIEYLKSVGAKEPWEILGIPKPPPPPVIERDSLPNHIKLSHCGNAEVVSEDILRMDWPIRILRLPEVYGSILCTEGMSLRAMKVPPGVPDAETLHYAELYIHLPEEWPTDSESLQHEEYRWVIEWMYRIARLPVESGTYLGHATIFTNGDPPQPLCEGTDLDGILVLDENEWLKPWVRPDGETVRFYQLVPVYPEERVFEREHGVLALIDKFNYEEIERHVHLTRVNAIKGILG